MGLDKRSKTWFHEYVKLLANLGLGLRRVIGISLSRAFSWDKKTRSSPLERERQSFEADVRQQLLKLKEKGLSLPVFTL